MRDIYSPTTEDLKLLPRQIFDMLRNGWQIQVVADGQRCVTHKPTSSGIVQVSNKSGESYTYSMEDWTNELDAEEQRLKQEAEAWRRAQAQGIVPAKEGVEHASK